MLMFGQSDVLPNTESTKSEIVSLCVVTFYGITAHACNTTNNFSLLEIVRAILFGRVLRLHSDLEF